MLRGPYASLAEGRYPDLTAAYFLLVMLVAALITLLASPSARSAALVAVTGASVVSTTRWPPCTSRCCWPPWRWRAAGTCLPAAATRTSRGWPGRWPSGWRLLGVLALAYAAYTYLLGKPGGAGSGSGGTSNAVSIALGSQPVLSVPHVLTALSSSVAWLGVLGLAALAAGIRYLRRPGQVLAALTLVLWCAPDVRGQQDRR